TTLANGDGIWRIRVVSTGALATELYFSDLFLPEEAELHVYTADGGHVLGGFTAFNNREDGSFATSIIPGESCLVEYHEPAAVRGEGRFTIFSIGHAYLHVYAFRDISSGPCQVDVNCSEGEDWPEQRDAVVRISLVDGSARYWCSGALVDNVAQDCKPYFLSAEHCGEDISASFHGLWKFYFNYERSNCGSGSYPSNRVMLGCTKRGASNDGGGDSGSDFMLLEALDPSIPAGYRPFWAGWDATGSGGAGGVSIHHPAGDRKKISHVAGNASSTTWGGVPGTHWRVNWASTTNGHGTTEGGSSGAPLFNAGHRVIGTLTGGSSSCANPQLADYFGKMSYHWQSNPGPVNQRLKRWLDPQSTGALSLDGSYDPCGASVGVGELSAGVPQLQVYPNPAAGTVMINWPDQAGRYGVIEVRDMGGRLVTAPVPASGTSLSWDSSTLAAGA